MKKYTYIKGKFYGIDKKCDEKLNLTDNFNNLNTIQLIDKYIEIILGCLTAVCCTSFLVQIFISSRNSLNVYYSILIIYIVLAAGSFSYHVFSYIRMVKSDYSN